MNARRPRFAAFAALGALVGASYAFRLPALLNARSTNSDAAVVGLQAMHLLRGEWSPFLWGSGYQTSADSVVAAVFFTVLGASPLALMLSSLTLQVIATLLVFATLRRRVTDSAALLLTMPMVVTTSCLHSYALYPPRQASLTLAVAAFWAIDRGARERHWLTLGGALATLAVSADPYPMLLVPLSALFALLVAWDGETMRLRLARVLSFGAGALLGLLPFVLLRSARGAKSGPMGLTTSMLAHHWDLLVRECLPWAIGLKVYHARNVMDYGPWDAPLAVRVVQIAGAASLAVVVVVALASAFAPRRRLAWPDARLGLVSGLVYPLAVGAFLVSVMVMDHFSMRYLAALALLTPFAALPAYRLFGGRRFALVFAPHLLATAIGGWVGYGTFVRGLVPEQAPELRDDLALEELLAARGIEVATADYWASYRLTLLWKERIVVVPTNAGEDRYRPYRDRFEAAKRFAYIHDRGRSREDVSVAERSLRASDRIVETLRTGSHVVFVAERAAPGDGSM